MKTRRQFLTGNVACTLHKRKPVLARARRWGRGTAAENEKPHQVVQAGLNCDLLRCVASGHSHEEVSRRQSSRWSSLSALPAPGSAPHAAARRVRLWHVRISISASTAKGAHHHSPDRAPHSLGARAYPFLDYRRQYLAPFPFENDLWVAKDDDGVFRSVHRFGLFSPKMTAIWSSVAIHSHRCESLL
jgi:hypothetical protein